RGASLGALLRSLRLKPARRRRQERGNRRSAELRRTARKGRSDFRQKIEAGRHGAEGTVGGGALPIALLHRLRGLCTLAGAIARDGYLRGRGDRARGVRDG